MTPAELVARHHAIGLDSNVLIYLLEGAGALAVLAGRLIDAASASGCRLVVSTVALAEVLAGPARAGDLARLETIADEVRGIEGLELAPVTVEIAVDAAVLRGSGPLRLPDALVLATARVHGASAFATNDRSLRSLPQLEIVYLEKLTSA